MAWAGLGAIGLPMALRLAGTHELVTNRHRGGAAQDAVAAAGVRLVDSPRAAAERADVLISMVRDEAQTSTVLDGPEGALAGLCAGSALVIMSTVSAEYCRQVARRCRDRGVDVVDAPVSGGTPAAQDGRLTVMVGGSQQAVERVRPVLDVLGDPVVHLGDVGSGQIAKIVNNAIKIAIVAVTTEQLDLAARAGVDPDAVLRVLRTASSRSHVVENWDYYYRFKQEHRPGGPLDILRKDLGLALELAAQFGVDVPVAAALESADVARLINTVSRPEEETQ